MPWPEYRSLLISCLLHLCQSSSYWNEDPVHFLWPLGNITFILWRWINILECTLCTKAWFHHFKDLSIKNWEKKKKKNFKHHHVFVLGEVRTPLWKDGDVELWQNSLSWQFNLFVLISHWEGLMLSFYRCWAGEHWRCVALLCSTLKRPFTFKRSKTTSVLSIKKCVFSTIKAPAPGMNICLKYICFLLLVSFVDSQINWYVGPYSRLVTRLSWLSVKSVITVAALQFFFFFFWCIYDVQIFKLS